MKILINKKIHLIQEIRLIHSLCDLGYELYIDKNEYSKLDPLISEFNLTLKTDECLDCQLFTDLVQINHSIPQTKFLNIEKPLIFPRSLIEFCGNLQTEKKEQIFFSGLITASRQEQINKLKSITNTEIIINSNTNGRNFPVKSFDKKYFKELASSQFIFCPNGDFIWSYRFFESIMCGAIPIVQNDCTIFKGFNFYFMEELNNKLSYNEVWVKNNLKYLKDNFLIEN
jgi:hypothetical protein